MYTKLRVMERIYHSEHFDILNSKLSLLDKGIENLNFFFLHILDKLLAKTFTLMLVLCMCVLNNISVKKMMHLKELDKKMN